ncbi:MAG: hypothetical protein IKU12_00435 [Oscillospiraceae bacterium]|nr:hypothetical protein [Oscillospiraceae bacterium]
MKRMMVVLSLALALITLSGCIARPVEGIIGGADGPTAIIVGETKEPENYVLICRVVEEDDGYLVLADTESAAGVYTLTTRDIPVVWDEGAVSSREKEIAEGSLVVITYGGECAESWPMQPGGVTEIRVLGYGFDDMCQMYLEVLEDLWEEDEGLNGDITAVSVDLAGTSLSPSEQAAVRWIFPWKSWMPKVTSPMKKTDSPIGKTAFIWPLPKKRWKELITAWCL